MIVREAHDSCHTLCFAERSIQQFADESHRRALMQIDLDSKICGGLASSRSEAERVMRTMLQRFVAVGLTMCLLIVGGLAYPQAVAHDAHHAHHQKSTHSTILCSWMCAAGQVLDGGSAPYLVERTPIANVEQVIVQSIPLSVLSPSTSRGPPYSATI